MFSLVIRHSLIILAGSLTMLNGLAGCASSSPTASDKLDQFTGATVTYVDVPLVFYRNNPSQAAYARNFVHAGPIQVNRSGTYKYYIWLASWNTMQVTDASYIRDRLESIVILAKCVTQFVVFIGGGPDDICVIEPG
jgi:hypothetical protein